MRCQFSPFLDPIVIRKFTVSAPGRVCLYGEHQDYLGMPSIVMAVNLRCRIKIEEREDRLVVWDSPKLGAVYSGQYDLENLEASIVDGVQDHKLAAMILAKDRGELPSKGWNASIDSDVPVQAGCSSSSALLVAWIAAMQRLSGNITSSGSVTGTSLTDGTATLTGGALTGMTTALTVAQGGTGIGSAISLSAAPAPETDSVAALRTDLIGLINELKGSNIFS